MNIVNKKKYVGIVLFTILLQLQSWAQSDCRKMFKDFFYTMQNMSEVVEGRVSHVKMTIVNIPFQGKSANNISVEVNMYASKDYMFYQTEYASYLRDKEDAFLINHNQKIILWADGEQLQENQVQGIDIFEKHRKLIEEGEVECSYYEQGNPNKIQMVLTYNEKYKKELGVVRVIYRFDKKLNKIQTMRILFSKGSFKEQRYIFNQINFDDKAHKPVKVRKYIFISGEKLKPEYQDYQLINNKQ